MGLPGSGKSSFAKKLYDKLESCKWYNADDIRKEFNDWDFSMDGRIRQAKRMSYLANTSESHGIAYVICDFVAPTKEIRDIFGADITVWMDTIKSGRFDDTNKVFNTPDKYTHRITSFDDIEWESCLSDILQSMDGLKRYK